MAKKITKKPLTVGNAVLIRTVTHYYTGKVEEIGEQEVLLSKAAWIADTGRFNKALVEGPSALNEVEPFPGLVQIGRGAIVDVAEWPHDLPAGVK